MRSSECGNQDQRSLIVVVHFGLRISAAAADLGMCFLCVFSVDLRSISVFQSVFLLASVAVVLFWPLSGVCLPRMGFSMVEQHSRIECCFTQSTLHHDSRTHDPRMQSDWQWCCLRFLNVDHKSRVELAFCRKTHRMMGSRSGVGEVQDCLVNASILLEPMFWYQSRGGVDLSCIVSFAILAQVYLRERFYDLSKSFLQSGC